MSGFHSGESFDSDEFPQEVPKPADVPICVLPSILSNQQKEDPFYIPIMITSPAVRELKQEQLWFQLILHNLEKVVISEDYATYMAAIVNAFANKPSFLF